MTPAWNSGMGSPRSESVRWLDAYGRMLWGILRKIRSELDWMGVLTDWVEVDWSDERPRGIGLREGLLVYSRKIQKQDPSDLRVAFRIEEFEGKFQPVLEIESDGVALSHLYPNGWADLDSPETVQIQIDFFDNLKMIDEVIEELVMFRNMLKHKGPREWSPRVMKPSMGAAQKLEEAVVINIVERKGWEPWRSDELTERVVELSDEHYKAIIENEGCQSLIEGIMGEHYKWGAKEGPREWSPRGLIQIGPVGIKKACIGFKDGKLESVEYMIRDTVNFMYEDALTPDDEDIRHAMQEAKEDWDKKYELEEWLWEPLLEKNRTERSILLGFMNKIDYVRKQGHYDRDLVFNFRNASEVLSLLQAWPVKDRADIKKTLEGEYRRLVEDFLKEFFKELHASMKDSDPNNRTDWNKHRNFMLADKARVEAVRKDIREFVKTASELPEDEE